MEIGYFLCYKDYLMKKLIFSIALACISGLTAHAQFNGKGYYRIKNATTQRYMSLCDNHSRGVHVASTSVDAGALVTKKNFNEVVTDPGTVFYIENVSGANYNISSQGSNVYDMIQYYIRLAKLNDGTYRAWQKDKSSGQVIILSDENDYFYGKDISYVNSLTSDAQRWYILPVNTEENYLGVKPNIEANGKYYATFFAETPFSFASSGMRALYISELKSSGAAIYKEIKGIVPAKTPVIIECSSKDPAKNKLKIEATSPSSIKDNLLTGVYFGLGMKATSHYNCTAFDAKSMRVLGLSKDGSLELNNEDTYMADIMIKIGSNYEYTYPYIKAIPHNTAYVKVSSSVPAHMKLFKEGDPAAGINDIQYTDDKPATIYNINGMMVRENATSTEGLPKGIYIFKGKKVVIN